MRTAALGRGRVEGRGVGAFILIPVVLATPAWAQPVLRQLGFLGSSGPSIANGVSADGTVVVGESMTESDGNRAFRWTIAGGMQNLGAFPNGEDLGMSRAWAASADGSVIVGSSVRPASLNEEGSPFRWTAATGLVFLGTLGGTEGGIARAVSADGSLALGTSSSADFSYRAFRKPNPGLMTDLAAVPFQSDAIALGVSADGMVIVGQAANQPVIWTNGGSTATTLQGLAVNALGAAVAVTPDGQTIAGYSNGRAVRWHGAAGTPQNLGLIPGGIAQTVYLTSAMSADGRVIVGLGNYNAGLGTGNPFIWDEVNGMRDLSVVATQAGVNLNGFQMFWPRAVSADGLIIAGYGFSATDQEAFVLDLHTAAVCYPNCDASTASPVLNVADFTCFLQKFAAGDPYANCDASTSLPVLNVADFTCFLQKYAAGCP